MSISVLEQLRKVTKVVADTGDFELIKKYRPEDATTNPSLILKAVKNEKYINILHNCIDSAKINYTDLDRKQLINELLIDILVEFGINILGVIDGKVSSEVDARISFDTQATIDYANKIIDKYREKGIAKERVLVKIASTWEGIQAAKVLQQQGINCNLTLLFDKSQAQACADVGVYLISPFVGRITDWQVANNKLTSLPKPEDDSGIISVKEIYKLYKSNRYKTIVMGASFRNIEQVKALAGCDALTIAPNLLEELNNDYTQLDTILVNSTNQKSINQPTITEQDFRWQINNNIMATYKLAEGINQFSKDIEELENIIINNI